MANGQDNPNQGLLGNLREAAGPQQIQGLLGRMEPLQAAAGATMPIPIVGDVAGLAADASQFIQDPASRTPLNFGLSALGMLPAIPSMSGIKEIKDFSERWRQAGIPNAVEETDETIEFANIMVPPDKQGQGIGSQFMRQLTELADEKGKPITLQPVTDLPATRQKEPFAGTETDRLENFFRGFGFEREAPRPTAKMRRDPQNETE